VVGQEVDVVLRTSGTGLAEELLAPPSHTLIVRAGDAGALLTATAVLRSASMDSSSSLAGAGLLGVVARPKPREADEVIAEAARAAAWPRSPSSSSG